MNPPPFNPARLAELIARPVSDLNTAELCELGDMLAWCQSNHVNYVECVE